MSKGKGGCYFRSNGLQPKKNGLQPKNLQLKNDGRYFLFGFSLPIVFSESDAKSMHI